HYGNGGKTAIIKSATSPGTVSYMTMFKSRAAKAEQIKAIVAGFENYNAPIGQCIITIFKNPVLSDGTINSYEESKAYSYTPSFSGFHTILLPTPFEVHSGDEFAVQIDVPHTTGVYHEIYEDINKEGFVYHFDSTNRKNYYKAAEKKPLPITKISLQSKRPYLL
ncbi:MAG: hypothetical protein K5739_07985, partial [Lachnospiraceae bacterium]|nr:hypothetical protein [Lachnospiraceae bacterium]